MARQDDTSFDKDKLKAQNFCTYCIEIHCPFLDMYDNLIII